jgi:hypothetical protein
VLVVYEKPRRAACGGRVTADPVPAAKRVE